ncbi:hypothetical protein HNR59_001500 [Aquamicrobium lusatiense]|uniref:Uncharacterized protein n=1 Tax=Aquamicrobium lusatiense TaxID=89772 RepID=A0A7W9S1G4_9HYPH|nr:hypothetical protein [Aquamicrobium lusatiense]MBB6012155.1 hypothetical protein [Aquamicrobium lusatiense]
MKTYILALSIMMAATPAFACTAEEVQSKAMEVSTKMQELAATNPEKAMEIGQKLATAQSQATTDLDGACKLYDGILEDLK